MIQQIKWFLTKLPPWCERFMMFMVRVVFYHPFYRGDKLTCPCCGKGHRKFKNITTSSFNANSTAHIETETLCTYCCSLPRQRVICHWLANNFTAGKSTGQQNILFAPEPCVMKYLKRANIPFKTSDLFRKGCDLQIDLCDIRLPDSSQDLLICNHILEHVPDDRLAISELARVLTNTGTLLVIVPMDLDMETTKESDIDPSLSPRAKAQARTEQFGQQDHVRLFGRDLQGKLEADFNVTVYDGSQENEKVMPKYGPFALDVNLLYVCTKKASA